MRAAFILAHPDDELGAVPLIEWCLAEGKDPVFFYMTNGSPTSDKKMIQRREEETKKFLGHLGIAKSSVFFLGSHYGLVDSALHRSLSLAKKSLIEELRSRFPSQIDCIVTLAWEGGHHDHDTTYFCARKAVQELGIQQFYQFCIYNRFHCQWMPFKVNNPLHLENELKFAYRFRDLFTLLKGYLTHRSQWKTWVGLAPVQLVSLLRRPYLAVEQFNPPQLERPHQGELLYEKMFGVPFEEVAEALEI